MIQSVLVGDNDQCELHCYVEQSCLSFNLGPGSGDKLTCELSNSDHYQHPGDLVSKRGFSYHPTAVSKILINCSRNTFNRNIGRELIILYEANIHAVNIRFD